MSQALTLICISNLALPSLEGYPLEIKSQSEGGWVGTAPENWNLDFGKLFFKNKTAAFLIKE
jgi:hypothetical protein